MVRTELDLLLCSNNLPVDRSARFKNRSTRQWNLRYCQDCHHDRFHLYRCRAIRSKEASSDRCLLDEHVPLDHWSYFQHTYPRRESYHRLVRQYRHGVHDLLLRHSILLLRWSFAMGHLLRDLQQQVSLARRFYEHD